MNKDKFVEIQIPEGHEIDKDNSTFEKIVFKKIENKYPLSVKEIDGRNYYLGSSGGIDEGVGYDCINQVSSRERAEALLALTQLVELRDACNEIDGGKEFNYGEANYAIIVHKDIFQGDRIYNNYSILHFRKASTRNLFLKTHSALIETAKEFIA